MCSLLIQASGTVHGVRIRYALKFLETRHARKEVEALRIAPRHPNIVRFYGSFDLQSWSVIGLELCDGTLDKLMGSSEFRQQSSEKQGKTRWRAIKDVASALMACHSGGLMHRDIKPDNSMNPIY
jgi:calcium-dependent protein kinase